MAEVTEASLVKRARAAEKTALSFLDSLNRATVMRAYTRRLPTQIDGMSGVLWWDDSTPLIEVALSNDDGSPGGYVLVSDHPHIPPVVEYTIQGQPLSIQLLRFWRASQALQADLVGRLYYLGPFDIALRLSGGTDKGKLVSIPLLETMQVGPLSRNPRDTWPRALVMKTRRALAMNGSARKSSSIVELSRKPVRYTQNCSAAARGRNHPPVATPCSPSCISGCGPVAWAMLASAYRRGYEHNPTPGNQYARLFGGSSDWAVEWPSIYQPNPSRSKVVEETIWGLHSVMSTGCDGSTKYNGDVGTEYIFKRPYQYIVDRFGAEIVSNLWGYNDFPTHKHFLEMGNPLIFCGNRSWSQLLARGRNRKSFSTGGDGHCVVAYGFDDGLGYDLVCMGWGTYFEDKFIAPETVSDGIIMMHTRPSSGLRTEDETLKRKGQRRRINNIPANS
jgi:hypothetical protein